jgi:thioester reductase-like protein
MDFSNHLRDWKSRWPSPWSIRVSLGQTCSRSRHRDSQWSHGALGISILKSQTANVQGTLDILALCATGKPKHLSFVSSTSVRDTLHFVKQSQGGNEVSEGDDLSGSATGLGTGYGQSKWVAEYLVRAAGARGLRGTIVRPGYVTGDKTSGVTNTDDFLIRMAKGLFNWAAILRSQIQSTWYPLPAIRD